MQCPTLSQLPPPPPHQTNWPWTEESPQLPAVKSDGTACPRISIVTPSYNQGQFIEATIRSVLLQGYANLEYIIIDGGSTDETIEIIDKYAPWITYWVSAPDRGQSDAIDRGFDRSTGSILGWLNSDDLLVPNALHTLAGVYQPGCHCWTGGAGQIYLDGSYILHTPKNTQPISRSELLHARSILNQVATFWTRELWEKSGGYLTDLHLAMDYELWLRFTKFTVVTPLTEPLGIFRNHQAAKTGTLDRYQTYLAECDRVRMEIYQQEHRNWLLRQLLIMFWTRYSLAKNYGWTSWLGKRFIPYL